MKKILLTQNRVVLVDSDDFERLSKHKWYYHHTGYAVRNFTDPLTKKRNTVFLHREVLGVKKGEYIDHINLDKLNCTKLNLRLTTYHLNNHNKNPQKNNTSGYRGVHLRKDSGKWRAYIVVNRLRHHLGSFIKREDAITAYNNAALKYYGEYAKLN